MTPLSTILKLTIAALVAFVSFQTPAKASPTAHPSGAIQGHFAASVDSGLLQKGPVAGVNAKHSLHELRRSGLPRMLDAEVAEFQSNEEEDEKPALHFFLASRGCQPLLGRVSTRHGLDLEAPLRSRLLPTGQPRGPPLE